MKIELIVVWLVSVAFLSCSSGRNGSREVNEEISAFLNGTSAVEMSFWYAGKVQKSTTVDSAKLQSLFREENIVPIANPTKYQVAPGPGISFSVPGKLLGIGRYQGHIYKVGRIYFQFQKVGDPALREALSWSP